MIGIFGRSCSRILAATLLVVFANAQVHAAASLDASPSRSLWLAPSYQVLFTDTFVPSAQHGPGLSAGYEFHLTPTFNVGLTLAYRIYPGAQATHQLGYGTILKHFFNDQWASQDGLHPFLDYGLLLQQTFVNGRSGSATSHDTRLGAGAVVQINGVQLFACVAGHYSRLQYFDIKSTWIPYVESQVGWVYAF